MTFYRTSTDGVHVSIAIGIIIGLIASFIQSLGLTIQRKSHVLNQALPEDQKTVEHRRPLWLLGCAIFVSSNILGSLFQIASLPVVILAPLGAVSLLWNAFFARFLLGDVFSAWIVTGTILIAGGAVLIAVFGIVSEPTRSIEDLLVLFNRPAFIAYFSLLGFVLGVCLVVTHIAEWTYSRRSRNPPSPSTTDPSMFLPVSNPITTTAHVITESTPLLDRKPVISRASSISLRSFASNANFTSSHMPLFLAISYASASGILSGMCLLFAKSGVELLLLTATGHNQFWRWQTWCLLIGLVVFALLQLGYLHKALVLADPTVVCPLAFCFYNVSSIFNGLVYFDQFSLIPWHHFLLVVFGIITLLGGIWVVSINNGGGGVDLGTWQESVESEAESVTVDSELVVENPVRVISPNLEQERSSGRTRVRAVPLYRASVSESHAVDLEGTFTLDQSVAAVSCPTHDHQQRDSLLSSPQISHPHHNIGDPLHGRRRLTVAADTRLATQRDNNPLATVGTGFSIGLSPVSPGFVILPRERRRRVSGLTIGSQERRPLIERSMSDGNIERLHVATGASSGIVQTIENHSQAQDSGFDRWKWVRDVFLGKPT